jgi:protease-4
MHNPFLRRLASDVPFLTAEAISGILAFQPSADDLQLSEHPMLKRLRAACAPQLSVHGDTAIVPIQGTLAHNPDPLEMAFFGVEDSRAVTSLIDQARTAPEVKRVLLRLDTPGGMMMGGPEIADAVMETRRAGKPVVAHIGGMGASLGYMIASQANRIIANRSAVVGSIGVIASVTDYSKLLENLGIKIETFTNKEAKFKGIGALGSVLSDEQRTHLQGQVDSAFKVFKAAVVSARPQVKPEAMQGQTFRGSEAAGLGLVDGTGNEAFALNLLKTL